MAQVKVKADSIVARLVVGFRLGREFDNFRFFLERVVGLDIADLEISVAEAEEWKEVYEASHSPIEESPELKELYEGFLNSVKSNE